MNPKSQSSLAIFGSDNATGEYFMLYFDETERLLESIMFRFHKKVMTWWRIFALFFRNAWCSQ